MQILPVLFIATISILAVTMLSIGLKSKSEAKRRRKVSGKANKKDRKTILREANRRLASNPKDPEALESLADLYYNEGEFKKAMRTYQMLLDQAGSSGIIKDGMSNLRYGLSAMQCEAWNEAYKSLMLARSRNPEGFEVNAGLGKLEFMRKNNERAAAFLRSALKADPEHSDSQKYLGMSLYRMKKYNDAVPYLKQAAASRPEDRESLYTLARSQFEMQRWDSAQKIFRHLRTDSIWGPSASLYSGGVHSKRKDWEAAAADYQIGLRHENIASDILMELRYRLAEAFRQTKKLDRALALLNEIHETNQNYKDVSIQIKKYRELNSNKNLQVYLLAPTNEFIVLCRRITQAVFPRAKIKVNDIVVEKTEYADLLTEVKTNKWEDIILFRFIRTEGQVGELFVRDLYAHCKELHAGRGFCFTTGVFSNEAVRFVEARLIDLVDKNTLMKIFKTIDSSNLLSRS